MGSSSPFYSSSSIFQSVWHHTVLYQTFSEQTLACSCWSDSADPFSPPQVMWSNLLMSYFFSFKKKQTLCVNMYFSSVGLMDSCFMPLWRILIYESLTDESTFSWTLTNRKIKKFANFWNPPSGFNSHRRVCVVCVLLWGSLWSL